jgi:putative GTP pyrophosphokinase
MRKRHNRQNWVEEAVSSYSLVQSKYQHFAARVGGLLEQLLITEEIDFHTIEHRAKSVTSVREKLLRPGKTYSEVTQLPDLAGLRIIV